MNASARALRVVVVGGGVVGLACADELVRAGHSVRVLDPAPGRGATWAAAGMLAPGGEAWFGEEALLRLGLDAVACWPAYAASLEKRSGREVDLRRVGAVLVAADRDDLAEVGRRCALLEASGVRAEQLDRRELRRCEPTLSGRVAGGALVPDDCHVNPRRVAEALLAVLGDRVVRAHATVDGSGVLADGQRVPADVVVVATGAVTGGVGAAGVPHVRPVRGEALRVRAQDAPHRVLRARVHGEQVYVVPRAGGEVVIGATEEEHPVGDGAPRPTVGGIGRLLESARELLPGIDTAEVLEVVARDRPGSPDNGPLIGPVASAGPTRVLVAGGHYRSGVLLAPLTAAAIRAHVDQVDVPGAARAFAADRFEASGTQPSSIERNEEPCA